MEVPTKPSDAQKRKEAADSLRQQIDDLVSGREVSENPSNLREFIEDKMAEDRKKQRKADAPATGDRTSDQA
jgi:hypothetical protein